MAKEYFSHDYNARNDPKCKALIKDFGMAGYGLYWALVEMMNEQGGRIKKFPALFKNLAEELRVKLPVFEKQVNAFINDYHLFKQDESNIWSESVLSRLSVRNEKQNRISEQRSEAGKIGGVKSGESRRSKQNEATKLKERKGKEIKVKENTNTVRGIYPKPDHAIELSEMVIGQSIQYIENTKHVHANAQMIHALWTIFKTKNFTGKKFYRDDRDIISHFINSLKYENIKSNGTHQQSTGTNSKPGTSEARLAAAEEY